MTRRANPRRAGVPAAAWLVAAGALAAWLIVSAASADEIPATSPDHSEPHPLEMLEQAIENARTMMIGQSPHKVVFRQTVASGDGADSEVRVLHVDTRKAPEDRLELVAINGQAASDLERAAYRKERQEQLAAQRAAAADDGREEEDGASVQILFGNFDITGASLLPPDPRSDDDEHRIFSLPHGAGAMVKGPAADMAEHMSMHVRVKTRSNVGPYIDGISVFNEKSFKPGLIGKVDRFEMDMRFAMIEDPGLLVPTEMNVSLKARALFKKIESTQRVTYTDHEVHAAEPDQTPEGRGSTQQ
ncbi:MAG: hypothetical protein RQ741_06990 [Wenzhouxiangellaceae bacterium]|nr:hypothetical protein [Wenzhouxiangellaceae bacterium]